MEIIKKKEVSMRNLIIENGTYDHVQISGQQSVL